MLECEKACEAYDKLRTRLAQEAKDTYIYVVFCTLTAARNPLLYQWDHDTEHRFRPKLMFNVTTVIVDERSTVIRRFLMIPVIVFFNVV